MKLTQDLDNWKFMLKCLHYLSIPFGMGAVVSVDLVEHNFKKEIVNTVYVTSLAILNVISIIFKRRREIDSTSSTSAILDISYDINTVVVSLVMLNTYRMNKPFTKITILFNDIEKSFEVIKLEKLGFFKRGLKIIFTFIPLVVFVILTRIYSLTLSFDFSTWETLNASCIIGVPFCICYYNIFMILTNNSIIERMKQMLFSIRDGTTWDDYNASPLDIVLMISKIHHNIFICSLQMADLFSSSFFCLNIVYLLVLVITAELTYENHARINDLVAVISIMIYLVLTPVMLWIIQAKVKYLSTILGECEICYTDLSMSTAKNTLLLQLIHEKFDMNIYGIFKLSLKGLLEQISQSITLVIFIFLLANNFK